MAYKCRLMLIDGQYLNLIVAEKSIHKGKNNASGIVVDYLINIGSGEVVFWTSLIQIPKIDTNPNISLFFLHRDYVGHPFS